MTSSDQLRQLPSVDDVLRWPLLRAIGSDVPRPQLVNWVRDAIELCRQEIQNGKAAAEHNVVQHITERIAQTQTRAKGRRLQPVINATGILLHTNLGRAPLADEAVAAMAACSQYANVELDLYTGKRSGRGERAVELLVQLTGAEDALIVNNCAAATMLVLQTLAAGREVIVSRGQLVEIGGGYRLPEVFTAAAALLKEVGTTNRTYLKDYEAAISERTGAIIRVHRSNFYQGGFVTEPDIAELVSLGEARNLPVVDDLGSGCMIDLSEFGWSEPTVPHSIRSKADLTLFSGDKMFGGPQAGIIVGKAPLIARLRRSPMTRALRVDKTTLAGIAATAECYLSGDAFQKVPLLQMLSRSVDEVRQHCERIASGLNLPESVRCKVAPSEAQVGGGSVPGATLKSWALYLSGISPTALTAALRSGSPAVLGHIRDNEVVLDLRSVRPQQHEAFVTAIQEAVTHVADQP